MNVPPSGQRPTWLHWLPSQLAGTATAAAPNLDDEVSSVILVAVRAGHARVRCRTSKDRSMDFRTLEVGGCVEATAQRSTRVTRVYLPTTVAFHRYPRARDELFRQTDPVISNRVRLDCLMFPLQSRHGDELPPLPSRHPRSLSRLYQESPHLP